MANHNYSQYSNKKNNNNKPNTIKPIESIGQPIIKTTQAPEVKMEFKRSEADPVSDVKLVQETVETVSLPKTVEGVVVNCLKLNVRVEPSKDAEVVCVLDAMSEVKIDVTKSTPDWFKITTAIGAEGYCMRKFVDAYL